MQELDFNEFKKKRARIGVRMSKEERNMIDEFCQKNTITISDFSRYAIQLFINKIEK